MWGWLRRDIAGYRSYEMEWKIRREFELGIRERSVQKEER